ncbi:hypothetical protein PaecuDRAFT_3238 [Paenibacillus curdlanolyticus YK9]|uniref:Uncharacterized protein n=1 Tax=Paenibacillus curdlanolyticus YK9 TaxID=717606 RepID=E0IC49_9BACL|nr:hypothetical protein PaecuDRAFT_3238 [Paenibacillus curdlanolyticus YK9]
MTRAQLCSEPLGTETEGSDGFGVPLSLGTFLARLKGFFVFILYFKGDEAV